MSKLECSIALNKQSKLYGLLKKYEKIKKFETRIRSRQELVTAIEAAITNREVAIFSTDSSGKKKLVSKTKGSGVGTNIFKGSYDIIFTDVKSVEDAYDMTEEEVQDFKESFTKNTEYTSNAKLSFLTTTNKDISDSGESAGSLLDDLDNKARRSAIEGLSRALAKLPKNRRGEKYKLLLIPDKEGVFYESKQLSAHYKQNPKQRKYAAAIVDMDTVSLNEDGTVNLDFARLAEHVPDFALKDNKPVKITLEVSPKEKITEEVLKSSSLYQRSIQGEENILTMLTKKLGNVEAALEQLNREAEFMNEVRTSMEEGSAGQLLDITEVSNGIVGDSKYGSTDYNKGWKTFNELFKKGKVKFQSILRPNQKKSKPEMFVQVKLPNTNTNYTQEVVLRGVPHRNGVSINVKGKEMPYIDFVKDQIKSLAEELDVLGDKMLENLNRLLQDDIAGIDAEKDGYWKDGKVTAKYKKAVNSINEYKASMLSRYIYHIFRPPVKESEDSLVRREGGMTSGLFSTKVERAWNNRDRETIVWATYVKDEKGNIHKSSRQNSLSTVSTYFKNRKSQIDALATKDDLANFSLEGVSLVEFLESTGFYEALPKHINFSTSMLANLDAEKGNHDTELVRLLSSEVSSVVDFGTDTLMRAFTESTEKLLDKVKLGTVMEVFQTFYKINKRPVRYGGKKDRLSFFAFNKHIKFGSNKRIEVKPAAKVNSEGVRTIESMSLKELKDAVNSDDSITVFEITDKNNIPQEAIKYIGDTDTKFSLEKPGKVIFRLQSEKTGAQNIKTIVFINRTTDAENMQEIEKEEYIHALTAAKSYSVLTKYGFVDKTTGNVDLQAIYEELNNSESKIDTEVERLVLESLVTTGQVVLDAREALSESDEKFAETLGLKEQPVTSVQILETMARGLSNPKLAGVLHSIQITENGILRTLLSKLSDSISKLISNVLKLFGITVPSETETLYDALTQAVYGMHHAGVVPTFEVKSTDTKSRRRGRSKNTLNTDDFYTLFKPLFAEYKHNLTKAVRLELLDDIYAKTVHDYVSFLEKEIANSTDKELVEKIKDIINKVLLGGSTPVLWGRFIDAIQEYKEEEGSTITEKSLIVYEQDGSRGRHIEEWVKASNLYKLTLIEGYDTDEDIAENEEDVSLESDALGDDEAAVAEEKPANDLAELLSRESKKPVHERISSKMKFLLSTIPRWEYTHVGNNLSSKPSINPLTGHIRRSSLPVLLEELIKVRGTLGEEGFLRQLAHEASTFGRVDYATLLRVMGFDIYINSQQEIEVGDVTEAIEKFDYMNPVFRQFWQAVYKHNFDVYQLSTSIENVNYGREGVNTQPSMLDKIRSGANRAYKFLLGKTSLFKKTGMDLNQLYNDFDSAMFAHMRTSPLLFKVDPATNKYVPTKELVVKLLEALDQTRLSGREFDYTYQNKIWEKVLGNFGIRFGENGVLPRKYLDGAEDENIGSLASRLGSADMFITNILGFKGVFDDLNPVIGVTRHIADIVKEYDASKIKDKTDRKAFQDLQDRYKNLDYTQLKERPITSFRAITSNPDGVGGIFDSVLRGHFKRESKADTTTVVNAKQDKISKYSIGNSAFQLIEELARLASDASGMPLNVIVDTDKYPKLNNIASARFRFLTLASQILNADNTIELVNIEGVRITKDGKATPNTTTDLNTHDWLLSNFLNWQSRGIMEIMRPETSSTTVGWRVVTREDGRPVVTEKPAKNTRESFASRPRDSEFIRFMEQVFVGEMVAMWEIKEEAEKLNLDFKKVVSDKFDFFENSSYLNDFSTNYQTSDLLELDPPTGDKAKENAAKKLWQEYFVDPEASIDGIGVIVEEMKRIKFDTGKTFDTYGVTPIIDNTFKGISNTTTLIDNFALDSKMYNIKTTLLFFGNATQYKSLYKRMKSPVSTGELISTNPKVYENIEHGLHKVAIGDEKYKEKKKDIQKDGAKYIRSEDPVASYDENAAEQLGTALEESAKEYVDNIRQLSDKAEIVQKALNWIQRGMQELNQDTVSAYSGKIEYGDGSTIIGLDFNRILMAAFGRESEMIKAYNWQKVFYKVFKYAKKENNQELLLKLKHGVDIGIGSPKSKVRKHRHIFSNADIPIDSGITAADIKTLNNLPRQAFVIQKFQAMTPALRKHAVMNKINPNIFIKTSFASLVPLSVIGTENEYLLDIVYGLNVNIATDSAIKGIAKADSREAQNKGIPTASIKLVDEDGNYTNDITETDLIDEQSFEVSTSAHKEQLRTSYKLKKLELLASQIRKLIQSDSRVPVYKVNEQGKLKYIGNKFPKNKKLGQAFEGFNNSLAKIAALELESLEEELGLKMTAEGYYIIEDRKKFIKDLVASLEKEDSDSSRSALELLSEFEDQASDDVFYDFSSLSTIVDRHLTSRIKDRISRIKIKGSSLTLKTSLGTKDLDSYKLKDSRRAALVDRFKRGKSKYFDALVGKLKFYTRGENGTTQAECMISIAQGDYKYLLNTPEVVAAMEYLSKENGFRVNALSAINHLLDGETQEGVDFKAKYKKQLTLFGYRIPTSGTNLMDSYTIRQFLPAVEINLIIVPPETVIKAGEDFDIDKKTSYFPSINKDGSLIKNSDEHLKDLITEEKQLTKELRKYSDVDSDHLVNLDNPFSEDINRALDKIKVDANVNPELVQNIAALRDLKAKIDKELDDIYDDGELDGLIKIQVLNAVDEYTKDIRKIQAYRSRKEKLNRTEKKERSKAFKKAKASYRNVQEIVGGLSTNGLNAFSQTLKEYSDTRSNIIKSLRGSIGTKADIESRLKAIEREQENFNSRQHDKNFATNQLIDSASDMLLDSAMYHLLVSRVSTGFLENDEDVVKHSMYDAERTIPSNKVTDFSTALEKRNDMTKGGQDLTGISAIETTFSQLFAAINMTLNINWTGRKKEKFKGGIGLNSMLTAEEYNSILDGPELRVSNPFNFRGFLSDDKGARLKSTILNQVVQATLDAATKSFVAAYNFTRETMPTAMYLIMVGVPLNRVMSFMTSPAVATFSKNLQSGISKREAYTAALADILDDGSYNIDHNTEFAKFTIKGSKKNLMSGAIDWGKVQDYLIEKGLIGNSDYYSDSDTSMKKLDSIVREEDDEGNWVKDTSFRNVSKKIRRVKESLERAIATREVLEKDWAERTSDLEALENTLRANGVSDNDMQFDDNWVELMYYLTSTEVYNDGEVVGLKGQIEEIQEKIAIQERAVNELTAERDLHIKTLFNYYRYETQASEILAIKSASDHDSAPPKTVSDAYSDMKAEDDIYKSIGKNSVPLVPSRHLRNLNTDTSRSTISHFYNAKNIVDIGRSASPIRHSLRILELVRNVFKSDDILSRLNKETREKFTNIMINDWIDFLIKKFVKYKGQSLPEFYKTSSKSIYRDFAKTLQDHKDTDLGNGVKTDFKYLQRFLSGHTTHSGSELIIMDSATRNTGTMGMIREELDMLKMADPEFYERLLVTIHVQDGMSRDAFTWSDMFNPIDWYQIYKPHLEDISKATDLSRSMLKRKKKEKTIEEEFFDAWITEPAIKAPLTYTKLSNKKTPKFVGEEIPLEEELSSSSKILQDVVDLHSASSKLVSKLKVARWEKEQQNLGKTHTKKVQKAENSEEYKKFLSEEEMDRKAIKSSKHSQGKTLSKKETAKLKAEVELKLSKTRNPDLESYEEGDYHLDDESFNYIQSAINKLPRDNFEDPTPLPTADDERITHDEVKDTKVVETDSYKSTVAAFDKHIETSPIILNDDGTYVLKEFPEIVLDSRSSEIGQGYEDDFKGNEHTARGNHVDNLYRQYNDREELTLINDETDTSGFSSEISLENANKLVKAIDRVVKNIVGDDAKIYTNIPALVGIISTETVGGTPDIVAVKPDGTVVIIDLKSKNNSRGLAAAQVRTDFKNSIAPPNKSEGRNAAYTRQIRVYSEQMKQMGLLEHSSKVEYYIVSPVVSQSVTDNKVTLTPAGGNSFVVVHENYTDAVNNEQRDYGTSTEKRLTTTSPEEMIKAFKDSASVVGNSTLYGENSTPMSSLVYTAAQTISDNFLRSDYKFNARLALTNLNVTIEDLFKLIVDNIVAGRNNFISRSAGEYVYYYKSRQLIVFSLSGNKIKSIKSDSPALSRESESSLTEKLEAGLGFKFSKSSPEEVRSRLKDKLPPTKSYRVVEEVNSEASKDVDEFFKELGKSVGVTYKEDNSLSEVKEGLTVLGVFNSLKNAISFKRNRDFNTISEETAHALLYAAWSKMDVKSLLAKYTREYPELYQYIFDTYSDIYDNQDSINFEFLSHVLMVEIKSNTTVKYTKRQASTNLFDKVMSVIDYLLEGLNYVLNISNFELNLTSSLKDFEIDYTRSQGKDAEFNITSIALNENYSSEIMLAVLNESKIENTKLSSPVKESRLSTHKRNLEKAYNKLTSDEKFFADNFVKKVVPGRFKPMSDDTLSKLAQYPKLLALAEKYNTKDEFKDKDFIVDKSLAGLEMYGVTTTMMYSRKSKQWYGVVMPEKRKYRYKDLGDLSKNSFRANTSLSSIETEIVDLIDDLPKVFDEYKDYHLEFNEKFNFIKDRYGNEHLTVPSYLEMQVLNTLQFTTIKQSVGEVVIRDRDEVKRNAKDLISQMFFRNSQVVYQGYKGKLENRKHNYFSRSKWEASNYGPTVREVTVDTSRMLRRSENEDLYYRLVNEFQDSTGIRFTVLDSSYQGLRNQEMFFEWLENRGYNGLDLTGYIDSQYIITFGENKAALEDKLDDVYSGLLSSIDSTIDLLYDNYDVKMFPPFTSVNISANPNVMGNLFDGSLNIVASNRSKTGFMFVETLADGTLVRRSLRDLVLGPINSKALTNKGSDLMRYKHRMPGTVKNMFIFANNSKSFDGDVKSPFDKIKSLKRSAQVEFFTTKNKINDLQLQADYIKSKEGNSIEVSSSGVSNYLSSYRDYMISKKTKLAEAGYYSNKSEDGLISTELIERASNGFDPSVLEKEFYQIKRPVTSLFEMSNSDKEDVKSCLI